MCACAGLMPLGVKCACTCAGDGEAFICVKNVSLEHCLVGEKGGGGGRTCGVRISKFS